MRAESQLQLMHSHTSKGLRNIAVSSTEKEYDEIWIRSRLARNNGDDLIGLP